MDFEIFCPACKIPFTGCSIYFCVHCQRSLDESCAELPLLIKHPFHPQHLLALLQALDSRRCAACGRITEGLTWRCSKGCEFGLCKHCVSLMPTTVNCELLIQQIGHPHPLIFCERKKDFKDLRFNCGACRLCLVDLVYVCLECCSLLIEHPFHPEHPLTLHKVSNTHWRPCTACGQWQEGLPWRCSKCDFFLCNHCVSLMPTNLNCELQIELIGGHPHPLILCEKKEDFKDFRFTCGECEIDLMDSVYVCLECSCLLHKTCAMLAPQFDDEGHRLAFFNIKPNKLICRDCGQSIHNPFFRCGICNFNVHVSCGYWLPKTVKSRCHIHTLTLTRSPVKDRPEEDDESDEFYCDACEEIRELRDPTYSCKECQFVAHVHCGLHEALLEHEEIAARGVNKGVKIEEIKEQEKVELKSHGSANATNQLASFRVPIDNEITAKGGSEVAASNAKEGRITMSSLYLEIDQQIVGLDEMVECINAELRAMEKRKEELHRRSKELTEMRALLIFKEHKF